MRANYEDLARGIHKTDKYLVRFFGNLLFGENHVLKNRELHIHWKPDADKLGVNQNTPNLFGANGGEKLGVKLSKNQSRILELIAADGKITMAQMAHSLSISVTAVENNLRKLKEKGLVSRVGSDKTGRWVLL